MISLQYHQKYFKIHTGKLESRLTKIEFDAQEKKKRSISADLSRIIGSSRYPGHLVPRRDELPNLDSKI